MTGNHTRARRSRAPRNPGPWTWSGLLLRLLLFPAGAAVTFAAFFLPSVPFALALLPLLAGLWSGARTVRFTAMTSFMIWPVFLSAWGLHGLEVNAPELVWAIATALVIIFGLFAAAIGILPTTLLLSLIPVFPASPLLPLAALLPGLGLIGLFGTMSVLTLIEATRRPRRRRLLLGVLAACLGVWAMGHGLIREQMAMDRQTGWRETPAPTALTERGRWLALREQLPEGATVIFGENLFDAEDDDARAFWCHAAETRVLTLLIGVAEPHGSARRGAIWQLDPESCAERKPQVLYRATLGIPGLTGTWGPMRPNGTPAPGAEDAAWLICLEAFLPWGWAGLLTETGGRANGTVIVLSNDSAFRPLPYLPPLPALGHPPVHVLRRKAATAMAGLAGRPVFFAETGRSFLLRTRREDN